MIFYEPALTVRDYFLLLLPLTGSLLSDSPFSFKDLGHLKSGFSQVPGGPVYNDRSVDSYHIYCSDTLRVPPFFIVALFYPSF